MKNNNKHVWIEETVSTRDFEKERKRVRPFDRVHSVHRRTHNLEMICKHAAVTATAAAAAAGGRTKSHYILMVFVGFCVLCFLRLTLYRSCSCCVPFSPLVLVLFWLVGLSWKPHGIHIHMQHIQTRARAYFLCVWFMFDISFVSFSWWLLYSARTIIFRWKWYFFIYFWRCSRYWNRRTQN